MDAGAATFLGIRAGHPGFAMLARDPALSAGVLRHLEWLAMEDVYKERELRSEVTAWLERRQQRQTTGSDMVG